MCVQTSVKNCVKKASCTFLMVVDKPTQRCVSATYWTGVNMTDIGHRTRERERADPSHIYNSSRPGETLVSARRTQDLLCACCSICVSLSPQKRRHSVCPELMFPAHVDYIMTYYSFILLKCIFCLYKPYTVLYLILFHILTIVIHFALHI